jgi:hypothetical protein
MDLQRQVALREEENSEVLWEFGSPVSLEGSAIVGFGGWGLGVCGEGVTGIDSGLGRVYEEVEERGTGEHWSHKWK